MGDGLRGILKYSGGHAFHGGHMAIFRPVTIKKRGESFQICFYNSFGERRRLSVGKDERYAQRLALKIENWLIDGKDPEREIERARLREQTQSMTIRDFFPVFMQRHGSQRSKSMQISYNGSMQNICRYTALSDAVLCDITRSVVIDYMHERMKVDSVKAATVNKDAAFLKCMLARAVEWDILEVNPLQGLKLFKEDGKRNVYLTLEEARLLIGTLPEPVAAIVEFAIYTGFRKENILSLKIESCRVHLDQNTGEVELLIKGNRRELFPLSPQAIDVIRQASGKRTKGFVFINPQTKRRYTCVHKSFDRAVEKLGLKAGNGSKLRFHDLRHVFATWLHREGVSLDSLRILLGHKDRATTDRYTSVSNLDIGHVLSRMPNLRAAQKKNTPDHMTPGV